MAACPVRYALDRVNGKWKLPIIWELMQNESLRFNALLHHLDGISNIMLSKTLQELCEDGIVARKQVSDSPLRVEYTLTERGRQLQPALYALGLWSAQNYPESQEIKA